MTALVMTVVLAVASAAAYATAAVLQERLAGPPADAGRGYLASVLGRSRWWGSVALNAGGGALHVAALAYGPLSVVQPLGVLTLVLALPIGAAAAGRRASARQWAGAGATVAGLALLLALTVPAAGQQELRAGEGWAVTAVATALVVGLALAARAFRSPLARSLLIATAAGLAFAVASALTQLVSRLAVQTDPAALASGLLVALAGMAAAGLLLSQVAYRGAGLGAPLATVTLANPIASAAIAVLVLGERTAGGAWGALAAIAGAGVAAWGVVLLAAPDRPASTDHGHRAAGPVATGPAAGGTPPAPGQVNGPTRPPGIRPASPVNAGRTATAPATRRCRSPRRRPTRATPAPASAPPASESAVPTSRPG